MVQFQNYCAFLIFKKKKFLIKSCILNNFYSYLFGHFFIYQIFLEWFQFFYKGTSNNFGIFRLELFHLSPYYFDLTSFFFFFKLHTCFIFNNEGKAVAPALTATVKGDSIDNPIRAQASLTNISKSKQNTKKYFFTKFYIYRFFPWNQFHEILYTGSPLIGRKKWSRRKPSYEKFYK